MAITVGKLKEGVKPEDLQGLPESIQFGASKEFEKVQDTGFGTLFKHVRVVPVQGENVNVVPFVFARLPEILVAAVPVFVKFKEVGRDNAIQKPTPGQVLAFFTENRAEVVGVVAAFLERDPTWVSACTSEEIINLFGAILEVNTDFFIQNLIPSLANLLNVGAKVIDKLKPFLGSILSNHS